jgi:hypothetical protein
MTAAIVMLGVVVALIGVLLVGLLRSNADVLRSLHDLGIGEQELGAGERSSAPIGRRALRTVDGVPAPRSSSGIAVHDVAGVTTDGGALRIGIDGRPGVTLLAFLSSGCTTCQDFWRAFSTNEVRDVPGRDTRVVVITRGPADESPHAVADLAPEGVTTVMSSAAWDDYGVPVSPYFMLVDGRRGVLGEGAATSWAKVVALLEKSLADLQIDLDGDGGQPTRRQLLTGMRHEEHASRVITAADAEPEAPDAP